MKKVLLLFSLFLCCVVTTSAADKLAYSIEFQEGTGQTITTSTKLTDLIAADFQKYLDASKPVSAASTVYNENSSIRLGSGRNEGNVKLNLSEVGQVNASKIVISAQKYKSTDTDTEVTINNVKDKVTATSFTDYEYVFNGSKLTEIAISTNGKSNNRVYIRKISVYVADEGGSSGGDVEPEVKMLGDIKAYCGDIVFEDSKDYGLKADDILVFSCDNATSITVTNVDDEVLTSGVNECRWVAQSTEGDMITVTALGDNDQRKALSFWYTATFDPDAVSYESSCTYDFTINGAYGMKASSDYDKSDRNIIARDAALDLKVISGNGYRMWEKSSKYDLRLYSTMNLTISVPEGGIVKEIVFVGGNDSKGVSELKYGTSKDQSLTNNKWTANATNPTNSVEFQAAKTVYLGKITVTYDMKQPAAPHIEEITEGGVDKIVVTCDDTHQIHYKKFKTGRQAPSRVVIADSDEWTNTDSNRLEIVKEEGNHAYGYSFKAVHAAADKVSAPRHVYLNESGQLTSVATIDVEQDNNVPVEYYDLQGRKLQNPTRGLVIRRQGTKVDKILL